VPPGRAGSTSRFPRPPMSASPHSPTPCAASRWHGGTYTEGRLVGAARQWAGRGWTENFAEPGAREGGR
jgi:hypothetical protein